MEKPDHTKVARLKAEMAEMAAIGIRPEHFQFDATVYTEQEIELAKILYKRDHLPKGEPLSDKEIWRLILGGLAAIGIDILYYLFLSGFKLFFFGDIILYLVNLLLVVLISGKRPNVWQVQLVTVLTLLGTRLLMPMLLHYF